MHRVISIAGLAVAASVASHGALAGTCVSGYGRASTLAVTGFNDDPGALLTTYPDGGGLLVRAVRELVLADTNLVKPVLQQANLATPDQQASMGAALGQSALACSRTDMERAIEIQSAVVDSQNPGILTAFAGVVGDIQTAAIGPAPAAPSAPGLSGPGGPTLGGVIGQESSGGVAQFASAMNFVPSAARGSFGAGGSGGGGRPEAPLATVPGPLPGAGLLSLGVLALIGGFIARLRTVAMRRARFDT